MISKNNLLAGVAVLTIGAIPGMAFAQDVDPVAAEPGDAAEADTSNVIVVQARRRAENIQEVPDAVTAFSAELIEDAGIETVDDAIGMTPGIEIRNDQQPGVYTLTVRGVSTVRNGQPPVAVVIDGVTQPSSNALTQNLVGVQQIEILKGPQGALYGRNSIGGAINIVTKEPEDYLTGTFELAAGRGDTYQVSGSLSGPIAGDRVKGVVSALYRNSDGLLDNVTTGADADWEETYGARARVIVDATDDFRLDFRGSYYRSEAGSTYYVPLGIATPLGPDLPLNTETGTIQGDYPSVADVESWDVVLKADWEGAGGTITSITSYNELKEENDQEIDWTPSSFLEGLLLTDVKGWTQELRYTTPDYNPVRFIIGGFYQDIDRVRGTNAFINASSFGGDLSPENKFMVPIAQETADQDWRAMALFSQLNIDVTDALELTLALRYDNFRAEEVQTIFGAAGPELSETFEDIQPKVSLAYQWTDDIMTYATVSRGWRPGGFNLPNILAINDYEEETLWNYELGFKTTSFGGNLIFNGAFYYIDYSNQQFFLLTSNDAGGPVQLLVNGEDSTVKGADFELIATPTDRLTLSAGVGIVDGELDAIGSEISGPYPLTLPGNTLPNTADHTISAAVQYEYPLSDQMDLMFRVDYSRVGETYWTLDNVTSEDAYDLVDLRAGVETDNWRVTGVVQNLFGEDYFVQVFDQRWSGFVTDVAWPSKPTYYGIELGYSF